MYMWILLLTLPKIWRGTFPTFIQPLSFVYLVIWSFISIDGSAAMFSYLLAAVSRLLSASTALSAVVSHSLSASIALSAAVFGIRLSRSHQIISQNLFATSKVYRIIWLALDHLDLLPYTEPARFLTTLCESTFKPRGFKAETM